MNKYLIKPIDDKEVKATIFSMHPNKAPNPDGMSSLFFQKHLHIINLDVVNAIKRFFHSDHMLRALNETLMTLIPKVSAPTNLTQHRPISLYNVLFKIVSKILANRLKKVMSKCINKTKFAFVPSRQIFDNILLTHEIMHFLKNKRKDKQVLWQSSLTCQKRMIKWSGSF